LGYQEREGNMKEKRKAEKVGHTPESNQTDFMEQALTLARQAGALDEVPVGAVVTRAGQVVGRGYNRRETDHNPCSHAEIEAITAAARALGSWRLDECELHVTLEPCPMCLGACQQARLPRVVYGAVDPKGGALSLGYRLHEDVRLNHRFEVVLEERAECGEILRTFFRQKREPSSKG
jgi:tRNA(adenine34) deaminase